MSDRTLTLLAIHLDDTTVRIGGGGTAGSAGGRKPAQESDDVETTDSASSGNPIAALIAAIVLLAGIATVRGRLRRPSAGSDAVDGHDETAE